jgi:hypothetical protein
MPSYGRRDTIQRSAVVFLRVVADAIFPKRAGPMV